MTAIAIDGPAGAGKSTIARHVAKKLGYLYVDTGALYRAIGLSVLQQGHNPNVEESVVPLLEKIKVSIEFVNGEQRVILCGKDVTGELRTPEVALAASAVSAIPKVRDFLFSLQRDLAVTHNVVMDGRDIGTVVLPQAKVKIFLTASPEERARRRYEEMLGKGVSADYQQVLKELKERDHNDSNRKIAPLIAAKDAVLADTTGNTLEESVEQLLSLIEKQMAQ